MNLVCATAVPPAWPAAFLGKSCQECASSADCPAASACQGGLCYEVCLQQSVKCGELGGATCGTCAAGACATTGAGCVIATPTGQYTSGTAVAGLVVDAAHFWFADRSAEKLYQLERATGKTSTPLGATPGLGSLIANSTDLFWTSSFGGGPGAQISKMSKQGGAPQVLYTFSDHSDICYELAVDEQSVYCFLPGLVNRARMGIWVLPVSGGAPRQLTTGWAEQLVVHGDRIYWKDFNGHAIASTPIAGGAPRVLAVVQVMGGLAVDDQYLYYGVSTSNAGQPQGLYRVATDGSAAPEPLAATSCSVSAVASGTLYFTVSSWRPTDRPPGLYAYSTTAGTAQRLLSDQDPSLGDLVVDGNKLYGVAAINSYLSILEYDAL